MRLRLSDTPYPACWRLGASAPAWGNKYLHICTWWPWCLLHEGSREEGLGRWFSHQSAHLVTQPEDLKGFPLIFLLVLWEFHSVYLDHVHPLVNQLVLSSQWAEGPGRDPVSKNKVGINWGRHLTPASGSMCEHTHMRVYLHIHMSTCTHSHMQLWGFLSCRMIFPYHLFSLQNGSCYAGAPVGSTPVLNYTGAVSLNLGNKSSKNSSRCQEQTNFFSKQKLFWKMAEQPKPQRRVPLIWRAVL